MSEVIMSDEFKDDDALIAFLSSWKGYVGLG